MRYAKDFGLKHFVVENKPLKVGIGYDKGILKADSCLYHSSATCCVPAGMNRCSSSVRDIEYYLTAC